MSRLKTIARELQGRAIDLLLFQEVHLWTYARLLARALPAFPYSATAPYLYAPKGGLLTLSRWPIERQHFVLFDKRGHWHTPGLADWLQYKGILLTRFTQEGMTFVVVNTHLLANYAADWSGGNRYTRHQRAELEQLAWTLDEIQKDKLVLVAGDFNIPTDSRLYQDFVHSTGLYDPLSTNSQPTFRPPPFFPAYYTQPLDHVLVRAPEGMQVDVSAQIVLDKPVRLVDGQESYLSDHSAIQAEIRFPA